MQRCWYCKRWFKNLDSLSEHLKDCEGVDKYLHHKGKR